jgi:hypothetical protein
MKKINFIYVFLLLTPFFVSASVSNGTIDSANKNALICHSVDCMTPAPGVINFAPTGTTPVTIDDTNGISGVAWGNELGWINFKPTGTAGLTINPSTGLISGKAWSQVSGWVNFSVTGQSVVINSNGQFFGFAWTGGANGGWIKFDCSFSGACVKTDWRPISARPVTPTTTPSSGSPAGYGGGGSTVANNGSITASTSSINSLDMCPNIIGVQETVPTGYAKDEGGLCVMNVDYCKNISGVQLTVPNAYIVNDNGDCVSAKNNIKNDNQNSNPKNTSSNINQGAGTSGQDTCPNLIGNQSKVPDGFVLDKGSCVPKNLDYCPNISGNQYAVPVNMKISADGECIPKTEVDMNQDKTSTSGDGNVSSTTDSVKILGYSFIPNFMRFSVKIPFISALMGYDVLVDLTSLILTVLILVLGVTLIIKKIVSEINS